MPRVIFLFGVLHDCGFRGRPVNVVELGLQFIVALLGGLERLCLCLHKLGQLPDLLLHRCHALGHIRILGPGCAGVWAPRVLRAAQGAHFDLRLREQSDLSAIVESFSGPTIAAVARGGESLYEQDLTGNVAWLLGSEGGGVSPRLLAAAKKRICIPMAGGSESLNVAVATAICLFEEVRQKSHSRRPPAVSRET
ncbi:MAG: TrmH family RNA methyltransferase [Rhodocyclaceae bacterium]|nr:MAG: TrmH family RNA methyltransferase [Rhodocyclaceae bacterium]